MIYPISSVARVKFELVRTRVWFEIDFESDARFV
jgi:hypothetical protein